MSASTQNQALAALLFLYRHVLGEPLPWIDDIVRAQRPERRRMPILEARIPGFTAAMFVWMMDATYQPEDDE